MTSNLFNTNLLSIYQTMRRHIKEDRRIKDMFYYNCNNRRETWTCSCIQRPH